MTKTRVINSLLVTLGPEEDAEGVADELKERDDVVKVSVLEVKGEIDGE